MSLSGSRIADVPLVQAALGRSCQLGSLYDARTDQFIPGVTLWDPETLKQNKETVKCPKVRICNKE